jgi:hypothetical protein
MKLKAAIDLVFLDTKRNSPKYARNAAQAVTFARDNLKHSDLVGSCETARIRDAYSKVLDASNAAIASALR